MNLRQDLIKKINELKNNKYVFSYNISVRYNSKQCDYRVFDMNDIDFICKALNEPEYVKLKQDDEWGCISCVFVLKEPEQIETKEKENFEKDYIKYLKFKEMAYARYKGKEKILNKLFGKIQQNIEQDKIVPLETIVKYFDLAVKAGETNER